MNGDSMILSVVLCNSFDLFSELNCQIFEPDIKFDTKLLHVTLYVIMSRESRVLK